jgi:hypothetical protein
MSAKKIKFDKAFVAKTFIDYCHSSAPYFEKRPEILYVIIMTLADVATELGIGEEYLREIRDRYPNVKFILDKLKAGWKLTEVTVVRARSAEEAILKAEKMRVRINSSDSADLEGKSAV